MPKGVQAVFDKEKDGKAYPKSNGGTGYALTAEQRGRKYAQELRTGVDAVTGQPLTDTQKAYRSGFLKDRQYNAAYYNYNQSKKKT